MKTLILASSSPYRRMLLERLRIPYSALSPDIDETPLPAETPEATVLRLACAKADAVASAHRDAIIIGSDQVAVLDHCALGKPGTHGNAVQQLRTMRGKTVAFHTALCVLDADSGVYQTENVPTTVRFRDLSDVQIEQYLYFEQPYDCAGSAKIEGLGIALVERVDSSDPTALIGLPLIVLTTMLRCAGIEVIPA